jgi:hypothetical protein
MHPEPLTTSSPAPTVHGCELGGSGSISGFAEQQQQLKQQLQRSMMRHSQTMGQQRQINKESLAQLHMKLAQVEQVRGKL